MLRKYWTRSDSKNASRCATRMNTLLSGALGKHEAGTKAALNKSKQTLRPVWQISWRRGFFSEDSAPLLFSGNPTWSG